MIDHEDEELCWPVEVEEPAPYTLLVKVRGDLDDPTLALLRTTLDEELGTARFARVVLDLSRVTLLPSPSVDLLRRLRRRCQTDGGHLVLVGTGHPAVHRPLRISGLLPLFDTRPTLQSVLMGRSASAHRLVLGGDEVPVSGAAPR
jgi:anti-anti-sigma factor